MYCTLCCSLIINTSDTPDLGFNHVENYVECPRCIFPSFLQCFSTNIVCATNFHIVCVPGVAPLSGPPAVSAQGQRSEAIRWRAPRPWDAIGCHGPTCATQHRVTQSVSSESWSQKFLFHFWNNSLLLQRKNRGNSDEQWTWIWLHRLWFKVIL